MLTQKLLSQERKMKFRWFVALSTLPLLGVVTAFGLVSESDLGLAQLNVTVEEIVSKTAGKLIVEGEIAEMQLA